MHRHYKTREGPPMRITENTRHRSARPLMKGVVIATLLALAVAALAIAIEPPAGPQEGSIPYDKFDKPEYCGASCHTLI